jgi:hypothetical protein
MAKAITTQALVFIAFLHEVFFDDQSPHPKGDFGCEL